MELIPRSNDLVETIDSLQRAPAGVRMNVNKFTGQYMVPAWAEELGKRPATLTQHKVLVEGADAHSLTDGFALRAGTSTTPLSGLLVPAELARAFEFGTQFLKKKTFFQRSRTGTRYIVREKTVNRQMPSRSRTGWVVYPAATKATQRLVSLWTQTIMREYHDRMERL